MGFGTELARVAWIEVELSRVAWTVAELAHLHPRSSERMLVPGGMILSLKKRDESHIILDAYSQVGRP